MESGPIDLNFHSRIVDKDLIETFLDTTGGVKNLVQFFLLDGHQGNRLITPGHAAIPYDHQKTSVYGVFRGGL